jgi:hypothetical protein
MATLEVAVCMLLAKAQAVSPDATTWQRRELLEAAREYGRAMNRVSRVRRAGTKQ